MEPLRRILCAVDFSEIAQRALAHAVALARQHSAALTVLHVVAPPVPLGAGPLDRTLDRVRPPAFDLGARERWADDVRRFAERFPGARPEIAVAEGVVHAEILAAADRTAAGLLCLGTHGRSGFERWVLGSVADRILRKAAVPVLTVAPRCAPPPAGGYARVLCPVDLCGDSRALLDRAAALASAPGARLTLLHCVEDLPENETELRRAGFELRPYRRYREEQARTRLAELGAAQPDRQALEVVVAAGRAWRAIVDQAAESRAELIVMGAQGIPGPPRLGSNTDRVVREAGCPVLTVRLTGGRT
jgi:nucleotide-binding universal stress UspA family protein